MAAAVANSTGDAKRGVSWGTVKTHKVYVVHSNGDENGSQVSNCSSIHKALAWYKTIRYSLLRTPRSQDASKYSRLKRHLIRVPP